MKTFWAGLTVAALALASSGDSGCACLKFFKARIDKPTIGTRASTTATLDVKSKVDSTKYLGCDIAYWNLPAGSQIRVVWQYYENESDDTPDQHSKGEAQSVSGSGTMNGYLKSGEASFAPGVYECKWSVEADKKIEDSPAAARIVVGKPGKSSGKSKAADDDDDAPKKKKSKKDDDD